MEFGTGALGRRMKALAAAFVTSTACSAFAQVYSYDVVWYSGAMETWTYEAGSRFVIDVYEDDTTPEVDVLFRFRNRLDVPLVFNNQPLDHSLSTIVAIQFDTGTTNPGIFSGISIKEAVGTIDMPVHTPGSPATLIDPDGVKARIAWSGDFAASKRSESTPRTDGVNIGDALVLRATLSPGFSFRDVIDGLNRGVSSAYVSKDHYNLWTSAEKTLYRANAPVGVRVAMEVNSIVPNAWNPNGHGIYVIRGSAQPFDDTGIRVQGTSVAPASILDTQTSQISVVASDAVLGPQALTYRWTVVSGGGAVSPASSATATYTPPNVSSARNVTLRLAISDGSSTVTRYVTLQVNDADAAPPPNAAPQISAASATPSTIWEGQQSQLSVTATDADGPQALSYAWQVVSGGGTLSNSAIANPVYTAPADVVGTQTVTLRVTVSDGAGSATRDVAVTVQDTMPPPPGSQILSQDFSVNSFAGWSFVDEGTIAAPSAWRIVSGELVQQSNIRDGGTANDLPKRGTYLLYEDGLGWTDYKARFRMRSTDDDTLGLLFRYIDNDNWYRFSWDAQLKQRRLVKKAGGVYTLLAADNVPYVLGQNYQVEVVAQGAQLEVWVDGVRVFQVSDASHNRGSVAFYAWQNNAAFFDNLVVEDLSGGNFNALPKIAAVTATPATILDNQTSQLQVTATDTDGPQALSYKWTIVSGGGALSSTAVANPVYTPADVVGTQTVQLKVEVSDGAATVSGSLTLRVDDANPPPLGPLLLASDFAGSAALTGWSVRDEGTLTAPSKWSVVSGWLAQQSNIRDGSTANQLPKLGTYLLWSGGANWANYRAKFKLRSTDDDTLGVMFRVADANNYYRFNWDRQLNQRQLMKRVGGVFTLLAADNVPYVMGQTYQVEVIAQGSLLEVWIDGVRVFQVNDASLAQGSIAFYSWQNTGAFFDDLQVNASE